MPINRSFKSSERTTITIALKIEIHKKKDMLQKNTCNGFYKRWSLFNGNTIQLVSYFFLVTARYTPSVSLSSSPVCRLAI
jgi:hypothetical protein